jgi:ABC-type antimicrobial peptide transport system permease subunit
MKAKDLLKFAVTGLKRRKARTFLTVLGVIIGTVCIVLMFAIGLSNYTQFERNMLSDQSLTEITVNNYSGGAAGGITDSTVQSIGSLPHVEAVSPVIDLPVTIFAGKYTASMQLRGVDSRIIDVTDAQGGVFNAGNAIPSIVLGGNTMQYFIDPENPPNYTDYMEMERYLPDIDLMSTDMEMIFGYETDDPEMPASQRYRAAVSGITEKSFNESSYTAYVDLAAAKRIIMENRELAEYFGSQLNAYTTVKIIVDAMENVEGVLEEVKKLGYETYSPTESIVQMREEQARQQGQLFAIGFISLFVSAIGIANTMYANILERRRDIGVMKVLGMKIRKIRDLFILESALIGTLGGLVGIGVSYIVVLVINTGTSETSFLGMYFYEGMRVSIPLWLSATALLIAVGVGILSGIYPAHKATKMSALEAMRN